VWLQALVYSPVETGTRLEHHMYNGPFGASLDLMAGEGLRARGPRLLSKEPRPRWQPCSLTVTDCRVRCSRCRRPFTPFRLFSRPPGCMTGTLCHDRNVAVCDCLSMQVDALGPLHKRVKLYVRFQRRLLPGFAGNFRDCLGQTRAS